jgi:hypothetical protein
LVPGLVSSFFSSIKVGDGNAYKPARLRYC